MQSDSFLNILQTSSGKEGFREDVETGVEEEVGKRLGTVPTAISGIETATRRRKGSAINCKKIGISQIISKIIDMKKLNLEITDTGK